MRYLEEVILLVSVFWMLIYFYGQHQLDTGAYHHFLLIMPATLILVMIVIAKGKED